MAILVSLSYKHNKLLNNRLRVLAKHQLLMWSHSGLKYNTLQLDIGLPQRQTPSSRDWQWHFLYVSAQCWSPPGLCAQPPSCLHCAPINADSIVNYEDDTTTISHIINNDQKCWINFTKEVKFHWQVQVPQRTNTKHPDWKHYKACVQPMTGRHHSVYWASVK